MKLVKSSRLLIVPLILLFVYVLMSINLSPAQSQTSCPNTCVYSQTEGSVTKCYSGYCTGADCDFNKNCAYSVGSCAGGAEVTCPSSAQGNKNPDGNFDEADCNVIKGWACDPDSFSTPIDVHVYADGYLVGPTTANQQREEAIGSRCGGNRNHGFTFSIPNTLKDGKPHAINIFAINNQAGHNPVLAGGPKTITCNIASTLDLDKCTGELSKTDGRKVEAKCEASCPSGYADRTQNIEQIFNSAPACKTSGKKCCIKVTTEKPLSIITQLLDIIKRCDGQFINLEGKKISLKCEATQPQDYIDVTSDPAITRDNICKANNKKCWLKEGS